MDFNKSKTFKKVSLNGFVFKNPAHVSDNFELYHTKHQNIGKVTVQIVPREKSVQCIFNSKGDSIKTRYDQESHFTVPIFTYRDQNYQYNVFYRFVTLGEIVAQRIVSEAPKEAIQKGRPLISASQPRIPAESEYDSCQTAAQICDYFEKQTGRSVYSKLNNYEINQLISKFFYYQRIYQTEFKLQNFDIFRYCFKCDTRVKNGLCSGLYSYDRTNDVCLRNFVQQRKKILINFATKLYRQLSPTFMVNFPNNSPTFMVNPPNNFITKNKREDQMLRTIGHAYQLRSGGFLGSNFDFKYPWLTYNSAFFLFKVLNSETFTNKYLTTAIWFDFFRSQYVHQYKQNCVGLRRTLFHVMKCGVTNNSKTTVQYKFYIRNYLPPVIQHPLNPPLIQRQNVTKEDVWNWGLDDCEQAFSSFRNKIESQGRRRPEVWERLM